MRFNVVVGNPPYQEETGAGTVTTGKKPIYHKFVEKALDINTEYICMIIPSRWTSGGSGLGIFKDRMQLNTLHLSHIVDFMEWDVPVFNSMMIAGGVMYFLYNKHYSGECTYTNVSKYSKNTKSRYLYWEPTFIRNNKLSSICQGVNIFTHNTLRYDCKFSAFGLESYERGDESGDLKLLSSAGIFNIHSNKITKNIDLIKKYKIAISGTTPGGGTVDKNGQYKVLAMLKVLKPYEVCTNTYLVLGDYDTEEEANYMEKYLRTKFVRALVQATITSMHIVPLSFTYVPSIDIKNISYDSITDEALYKKYTLKKCEIDYIEDIIKPM